MNLTIPDSNQKLHAARMNESRLTEPFLVKLRAAIDADDQLNPANLATKAGLGNSAIRLMFKNNSRPRVDTMRKICAALDTTLEAFMSDASSEVEKEIVALTIELPDHLRHELLGYGRALLERHSQVLRESDEE